MTRRRMSTTRRVRVFEAAKGICHICGQAIDGTREAWEVEHVIPYALTRDDSDDNLRPAHVACHADKTTRQDVPQIAKAKRVHAKHIGAHQPRSRLPGGRGDKLKRKIGGGVVPRHED